MSTEAYITRVKKLLRLARDLAASPAESANALNRALDLINLHKIDVATLDLDEPTEKLVRENIHIGERMSLIKFLVARALENHFHVRCCRGRVDLSIVGFETDVTIAGYVFDFLVRACTRSLSDFTAAEKRARRKIFTAKRENFIRGWMYGVVSKLRKKDQAGLLPDSPAALVVTQQKKAVDQFFDQEFPTTNTIKRKPQSQHNSALNAGWVAGRKTEVTTPLQGGKQTLLLE